MGVTESRSIIHHFLRRIRFAGMFYEHTINGLSWSTGTSHVTELKSRPTVSQVKQFDNWKMETNKYDDNVIHSYLAHS